MRTTEKQAIQNAINNFKECVEQEQCSELERTDIEARIDVLEWVLSKIAC